MVDAFGALHINGGYREETLVQLECEAGRYQSRIGNFSCLHDTTWDPNPATICILSM